MKKIFTAILALFFVVSIGFGQNGITWISAGVKAGFGTSFLFNMPSFNDPDVTYKFFTPSYTYGAKLAFSFNQGAMGFQLEYNNSAWGQNFTVNDGTNITTHSASYSTMGFGLIFKAVSLGGFYFELGPQYNLVRSASLDGNSIRQNSVDQYTSAVIGLGFMPLFGKKVELSIGLRGIVSLGNINSVDAFSIYSSSPNFSKYTNNNTTSIMLVPMVDFTYVFAMMGRASCGKFRIMRNR